MKRKIFSVFFALVLVLSLSLVTAAPAAAATITVDASGGKDHTTIQAAINAAGTGDTIIVYPATYAEQLVIGVEGLILQSDAGAATTIIDGGGMMGPGVRITAPDVTLQGFTITNFTCTPYAPPEYPSGAGMGAIWATGDGVVIDGNTIYNIRSTVTPEELEAAQQDPSMWPAGIGIDVAASDAAVTNNTVYDVDSIGIRIRSNYEEAWPGTTLMTGILVEGNTVHDTANTCFVVAGNVADVTIKGNEIYGSLSPNPYSLWILTHPGGTPTNVTVEGNTISGGYANVRVLGANSIAISGNTITGAIPHCDNPLTTEGKNIYIQGASSNITIANNDILGADGYGVNIKADVAEVGTITINNNNILGNTDYGVLNETTTVVDATSNWWGSSTGPTHASNSGGIGDAVSDYVNFAGFLTQAQTSVVMTSSFTAQIGISVTPTSIDFGNVVPGVESGPQSVTVTNTGNVAEDLTASITSETPPGVYTGTPGLEIATLAVDDWAVTVAPAGTATPTLTLTVPVGTASGTYTAVLIFWAEQEAP